MSSLFSLVAFLAFFAMLFFIFQARKKRPGASRKAWMAAGAVLLGSVLSGATMTGAERAEQEAREIAQAQAEQQAAASAAATKAAEERKRQAEADARAKAEAERKANQSIDPGTFVVACERMIRERMKLPNTVKFPGFWESVDNQPVITAKGGVYKAWVEAENSFGGTVRNDFVCTYDKATDQISYQLFDR